MTKIAALFVQSDGCYQGLRGVIPFDEQADARTYRGPYSVIAHPPCNTWCKYARANETRYGIPVGSDGGCFDRALWAVRRFGGVLEHPAMSIAFQYHRLGTPKRGVGWVKASDGIGFICEVYQGRYGHRAPKPTWLYAVGCKLPNLDFRSISTGVSCAPLKSCECLGKKERSATPIEFRSVLIKMARSVTRGRFNLTPQRARSALVRLQ